MIICSIAFGINYSTYAQNLVNSFLQFSNPLDQLIIITDKPDLFIELPRIHIIKESVNIGHLANSKYLAIKYAHLLFPSNTTIMYLDADCYLRKSIDPLDVDVLPIGLHACTGKAEGQITYKDLSNEVIAHKWQQLHPDISTKLSLFVERAFILKCEPIKIKQFADKWKQLMDKVIKLKLTSCAECIEIQIACLNLHVPVHNLFSEIQGAVYTLERDGARYPAFR